MFLFLAVILLENSLALSQEEPRTKLRDASRNLSLPARQTSPEAEGTKSKSLSVSNGLWNTTISLGIVIGIVAVLGRWMKHRGFRGPAVLPEAAFEVLGKRTLDAKTTVHMVKFGHRILLLGAGPEGIRTLSEIDDKLEVLHLSSVCREPREFSKPITETTEESDSAGANKHPSGRLTSVFKRVGLLLLAIWLTQGIGSLAFAQGNREQPPARKSRTQAEPGPAEKPGKVLQAGMEQVAPQALESSQLFSPQQMGVSLKVLALMTVFSLAPSILMMTTSFVRFVVVLGLLRQAIGTSQGPPTQVLTAICLFLTFLVMSPVWQRCYDEGIRPYTSPNPGQKAIDEETAIARTIAPVREFMSQQIEKAGNADAVWMLWDYQQSSKSPHRSHESAQPESYDDVPITVLAPAYLLSELKVGFLIGFQLFLPFLVVDLVVSLTLASLGLNMLPPSMISLPFKLLLFVLIDGWFLTIGMLLESVRVA